MTQTLTWRRQDKFDKGKFHTYRIAIEGPETVVNELLALHNTKAASFSYKPLTDKKQPRMVSPNGIPYRIIYQKKGANE
jgi:hypothetical protein